MKTLLIVFFIALLGFVGWQIYFHSGRSDLLTTSPTPEPTNAAMLDTPEGMPVETQTVAYHQNVSGYYVIPEPKGEYPGVVMIHEWWGLNEHIKDMAETLASQGYQVLAVDLFQGQVAQTPDQARTQVSQVDQNEALSNLSAAVDYLRSQTADRVASLGWCFGGGQSLQLSLSNANLDGTIIYYGNLITDQSQLSAVDGPVLGIFGSEDTSIPVEQVQAFQTSLDDLDIENHITIYPGVGHAFANPSGENYASEPTQDAWNKTLEFLAVNLKTS